MMDAVLASEPLGDGDTLWPVRRSSLFHRLRQIALTDLAAHNPLARLKPLLAPALLDELLEERDLPCAATV